MISNCFAVREFLPLAVDGGLEAEQQREVEIHLESCRGCAAELEALRRTVAALSAVESVPPPEMLARLVSQHLALGSKSGAPYVPPWRPELFRVGWMPQAFALFVILAAILAMLFMLTQL